MKHQLAGPKRSPFRDSRSEAVSDKPNRARVLERGVARQKIGVAIRVATPYLFSPQPTLQTDDPFCLDRLSALSGRRLNFLFVSQVPESILGLMISVRFSPGYYHL